MVDTLPGAGWSMEGITFLEQHLQGMRRIGRARTTIAARRRTVVLLAQHLGHDPLTATLEELEAWQTSILEREPAPWGDPVREEKRYGYVRVTTAVVRPYFRELAARGLRSDDPGALLGLPPARHQLPRPIRQSELDLALADPPALLRPWLLLGLLGLRCVEIARLRGEDLHIGDDGRRYLMVRGKRGRKRELGVPTWMWPQLAPDWPARGEGWRKVRGGGFYGANAVSDYVAKYLHSLGIDSSMHKLRHRAATEVLRETGNVRLVQQLLGHANLASLHIYTEVESRDVAAALEALTPPAALGGTRGVLRAGVSSRSSSAVALQPLELLEELVEVEPVVPAGRRQGRLDAALLHPALQGPQRHADLPRGLAGGEQAGPRHDGEP